MPAGGIGRFARRKKDDLVEQTVVSKQRESPTNEENTDMNVKNNEVSEHVSPMTEVPCFDSRHDKSNSYNFETTVNFNFNDSMEYEEHTGFSSMFEQGVLEINNSNHIDNEDEEESKYEVELPSMLGHDLSAETLQINQNNDHQDIIEKLDEKVEKDQKLSSPESKTLNDCQEVATSSYENKLDIGGGKLGSTTQHNLGTGLRTETGMCTGNLQNEPRENAIIGNHISQTDDSLSSNKHRKEPNEKRDSLNNSHQIEQKEKLSKDDSNLIQSRESQVHQRLQSKTFQVLQNSKKDSEVSIFKTHSPEKRLFEKKLSSSAVQIQSNSKKTGEQVQKSLKKIIECNKEHIQSQKHCETKTNNITLKENPNSNEVFTLSSNFNTSENGKSNVLTKNSDKNKNVKTLEDSNVSERISNEDEVPTCNIMKTKEAALMNEDCSEEKEGGCSQNLVQTFRIPVSYGDDKFGDDEIRLGKKNTFQVSPTFKKKVGFKKRKRKDSDRQQMIKGTFENNEKLAHVDSRNLGDVSYPEDPDSIAEGKEISKSNGIIAGQFNIHDDNQDNDFQLKVHTYIKSDVRKSGSLLSNGQHLSFIDLLTKFLADIRDGSDLHETGSDRLLNLEVNLLTHHSNALKYYGEVIDMKDELDKLEEEARKALDEVDCNF